MSERRVLKEKKLGFGLIPFFSLSLAGGLFFFRRAMGRTPADRPLKVNPKKGPGGGQLACADELAAFLACMMVRVRRGRRAGRRVPAAASIDGGEQRGANHPLITHSSPLPPFLALSPPFSPLPDQPHGRGGRVRRPSPGPGRVRGGGGLPDQGPVDDQLPPATPEPGAAEVDKRGPLALFFECEGCFSVCVTVFQ